EAPARARDAEALPAVARDLERIARPGVRGVEVEEVARDRGEPVGAGHPGRRPEAHLALRRVAAEGQLHEELVPLRQEAHPVLGGRRAHHDLPAATPTSPRSLSWIAKDHRAEACSRRAPRPEAPGCPRRPVAARALLAEG